MAQQASESCSQAKQSIAGLFLLQVLTAEPVTYIFKEAAFNLRWLAFTRAFTRPEILDFTPILRLWQSLVAKGASL
jgi:hypothetical protein